MHSLFPSFTPNKSIAGSQASDHQNKIIKSAHKKDKAGFLYTSKANFDQPRTT